MILRRCVSDVSGGGVGGPRNDSSKTLRIVDEDDNNNNNLSVTAGSPHPADPLRAAKVYCYVYAAADRTERQEIPQRGGGGIGGGCASVTRGKSSCQNPFCSRDPFTPLRFHPPPRRNALRAGESSSCPLARTPPRDGRPLRVFFTRPNRPRQRRHADRTLSPSSGLVSVCC